MVINRFRFSTNSYKKEEVILLIKILKENFDLDCSLQLAKKDKDQYIIYVKYNSMEQFRNIVTPYFHESMKFKLIKNVTKSKSNSS